MNSDKMKSVKKAFRSVFKSKKSQEKAARKATATPPVPPQPSASPPRTAKSAAVPICVSRCNISTQAIQTYSAISPTRSASSSRISPSTLSPGANDTRSGPSPSRRFHLSYINIQNRNDSGGEVEDGARTQQGCGTSSHGTVASFETRPEPRKYVGSVKPAEAHLGEQLRKSYSQGPVEHNSICEIEVKLMEKVVYSPKYTVAQNTPSSLEVKDVAERTTSTHGRPADQKAATTGPLINVAVEEVVKKHSDCSKAQSILSLYKVDDEPKQKKSSRGRHRTPKHEATNITKDLSNLSKAHETALTPQVRDKGRGKFNPYNHSVALDYAFIGRSIVPINDTPKKLLRPNRTHKTVLHAEVEDKVKKGSNVNKRRVQIPPTGTSFVSTAKGSRIPKRIKTPRNTLASPSLGPTLALNPHDFSAFDFGLSSPSLSLHNLSLNKSLPPTSTAASPITPDTVTFERDTTYDLFVVEPGPSPATREAPILGHPAFMTDVDFAALPEYWEVEFNEDYNEEYERSIHSCKSKASIKSVTVKGYDVDGEFVPTETVITKKGKAKAETPTSKNKAKENASSPGLEAFLSMCRDEAGPKVTANQNTWEQIQQLRKEMEVKMKILEAMNSGAGIVYAKDSVYLAKKRWSDAS